MARTILVFFGPPGSGKGTQSDMLADALNFPSISTGELLRREQKTGSVLGRRAKRLMSSGKLVSETLIDHVLWARLARSDAQKGFMLDGYPRNEQQFKHLLKLLHGDDRLYFIEIEVSDKEVLRRLSGRRVCDCGASYHLRYNPPRKAGKCDLCGKAIYRRADDEPAVIKRRLADYHSWVTPLLERASGRGSVIIIDGEQSISGIQKQLRSRLKKFGVEPTKKKTKK